MTAPDLAEAVERLGVLVADLRVAALPTKPDVVTLCGYPARQAHDALSLVLTHLDALRERAEGAERKVNDLRLVRDQMIDRWQADLDRALAAEARIAELEGALKPVARSERLLAERVSELEKALRECADDLEAEVEARRPGELPQRIERDLDVVRRARAALAEQDDQHG